MGFAYHPDIKEPHLATESRITSKGQVTIPKEIRDRLGLVPGDKIMWSVLSTGIIIVRPRKRKFRDLAGSLTRPGQPSVGIDEMKR